METNQITKKPVEQLIGKQLNDDEVSEIVFNVTSFIEMLAEIDRLLKLHSKHKNKVKE